MLRQWLTWDDRTTWGRTNTSLWDRATHVGLVWLLRSNSSVTSLDYRGTTIMHGVDWLLHLWWLAVASVWLVVALAGGLVGTVLVTAMIRMAVVAASWLRDIGDDLHATRNNSSGAATPRGIGRGCGATESLGKLLKQRATHIVGCDMNCIRNTEDNERAFGRKGEGRVGCVEASTRSFLNFTNAHTPLANDRAN